jgi:glycosyltransferase involved in cell wall biosynthesis
VSAAASGADRAFIDPASGGGGGSAGGGGPAGGGGWGGDEWRRWRLPALAAALAGAGAAAAAIGERRRRARPPPRVPYTTVVVPALNEAKTIEECLRHLQSLDPPPREIIVVDGGSADATVALARGLAARDRRAAWDLGRLRGASPGELATAARGAVDGAARATANAPAATAATAAARLGRPAPRRRAPRVRVLRAGRGRARQMNAGAAAANGELLLFVHADSRPPRDALSRAAAALADPGVVLGGFATSIEHPPGRPLLGPSFHNMISSYYAPLLFAGPAAARGGLKCLFGDQSLFCRAADFRRAGGYDGALPIMEDADLCVRMHEAGLASGKRGREVQLVWGAPNRTSGRRLAPMGALGSTIVHWRVALAWWRGAPPAALRRIYDEVYTDGYR